MSFDDDPMMKYLRLDELRRELMYVKLDTLGLQNLEPLRNEIEVRKAELKIILDARDARKRHSGIDVEVKNGNK